MQNSKFVTKTEILLEVAQPTTIMNSGRHDDDDDFLGFRSLCALDIELW